MSRSNPGDSSPNPASRWFEWDGAHGIIRYWDKNKPDPSVANSKGSYVNVGDKFTFLFLDELSTVKGWHDGSDSGIYSNEVRDTKSDVLVVKAFKGGILAEGLYSQIRDRIGSQGGSFVASLYIGYKDENGNLAIGNLQLKGAALNVWVDFKRDCKTSVVGQRSVKDYFVKAIQIVGSTAGKKGSVSFKTPKFGLSNVSDKTNTEANALDQILQSYLKSYLSRTKVEQVAQPPAAAAHEAASPIPPEAYEDLPSGKPPQQYEPAEPVDDAPF